MVAYFRVPGNFRQQEVEMMTANNATYTLSDLLRTGAEPADQAEETAVSGETGATCRANDGQSNVAHALPGR